MQGGLQTIQSSFEQLNHTRDECYFKVNQVATPPLQLSIFYRTTYVHFSRKSYGSRWLIFCANLNFIGNLRILAPIPPKSLDSTASLGNQILSLSLERHSINVISFFSADLNRFTLGSKYINSKSEYIKMSIYLWILPSTKMWNRVSYPSIKAHEFWSYVSNDPFARHARSDMVLLE